MINCNEKENDNGRTDHINKTYIDVDVRRDKYRKYLIGKNFVGENFCRGNFSPGKIFVTCKKFRHFSPTKIFPES